MYKALKTDMDVENDVGGLLNCQAIQTITVPKSFVEDYGNNYITNNYTIARDDVVVDGVQCYQFAKNGQRA